MQVSKVVEKGRKEVKRISESDAVGLAIYHTIQRHRVSPASILAVDCEELPGSWIVWIYLKYSPIAVVVEVEKSGKIFSSKIRELALNG